LSIECASVDGTGVTVPHDVHVSAGHVGDPESFPASAVAHIDGGMVMTVAHLEHVMDCGWLVKC
jgi:hypothetical protein